MPSDLLYNTALMDAVLPLVGPLLQDLYITPLSISPATSLCAFYVDWEAASEFWSDPLVPSRLSLGALCLIIGPCLFSAGSLHAQSELFVPCRHDSNSLFTTHDSSGSN